MAFTDFKSADEVQKAYRINYTEEDFLPISSVSPPEQFIQDYEFSRQNFDIFSSEAARCENVIYPILREACKKFVDQYSIWSHKSISADSILTGTPDYIFGKRSELGKNVIEYPLILIVEAKQNDFMKGWGQCLSELVAAQKLNKTESLVVYGIVTDAELWQFGKLDGKHFTKNYSRVTINDLSEVFGSVCSVVELAAKSSTVRASKGE
ncbi:hypothetical protein [Moorena sp. SIO3H5]|uniref:hypothetical protein n=1 Tax=Moorena sp. SIO3H5 TaxID=2607834 RepID=UPI0013BC3B8E|nr:hypothetical protein [Moorena sp. SIO3H5]NEO73530.1 hypothetical protein [Moorena sp. SIO3H5]